MPVRLAAGMLESVRSEPEKSEYDRLEYENMDCQKSGPCRDKKKRFALFKDLGVLEYNKALALQIKTIEVIQDRAKLSPCSLPDQKYSGETVFFVEHPPVFTLGKRGGLENLTVSNEFLNSKNVDIVKTDRGGNITWHGPGQAVLYPVIDLEKNRISVKDFVHGLEEIMKLTASDFNIKADRDRKNHGIWVGNAKIGSVGISVKRGISMHGLALNINPDLEAFSWINPCGLNDISMTSLKKELLKNKSCDESAFIQLKAMQDDCSSIQLMERVKKSFQKYFSLVFDFELVVRSQV